jgi:hypothetical protein
VAIRSSSNPAKQNQYQKDDDYDSQAATAVVAGPVEWAATKSAETSKQDDDQDNEQNGSDRHEIISECLYWPVARRQAVPSVQLAISSV